MANSRENFEIAAPRQALMQNSAERAEEESGGGASLQNAQTKMLGKVYDCCCVCCVICGCSGNLITIQQGSVGVVTEFGRYTKTIPPGRHTFNIMAESIVPISMRTVCLDVPAQSLLTKDNLNVRIDAVGFYQVFDAQKAAFSVENYPHALCMLAQVTIRSVLGEMTLAEVLCGRATINSRLRLLLDESTDPWGIKVDRVELKEIGIDPSMQRAMAAKAEAHQEAEAKIIQANAQLNSSKVLAEAAASMSENPSALKLQWFETLRIISTQGKNTTIIVPDNINVETALASAAIAGR